MPRQESDTDVREWVDEQTRHVDVVASWESLCDTYETLRFSDPLSDAERLDEYKWIVQQMNSFLTKIRTKLMACKDQEAMIRMLSATLVPAGRMELGARRALVYQKLRQQWVMSTIAELRMMTESQTETEDYEDGWEY